MSLQEQPQMTNFSNETLQSAQNNYKNNTYLQNKQQPKYTQFFSKINLFTNKSCEYTQGFSKNDPQIVGFADAPQCGPVKATSNLIKSGLEVTVFFMPLVYVKCGLITTTVFLIISGIVCYYSWNLMLKVLNNLEDKNLNLTKALGIVFGKKMEKLCDYMTIFYNLTTLIAFTIVITELQSQFLEETFHTPHTEYISLFLMFMIYLTTISIRTVDKLGIYSMAGLFICLLVFVFVLKYSIHILFTQGYHERVVSKEFSMQSIYSYFGLIIFYYDVNGILTEIRASMEKPRQFKGVLQNYCIFMCFIAIMIGSLGALALGDNIKPIILQNMSISSLSFLYSFPICITYIIIAFPVFQSLDEIIAKAFEIQDQQTQAKVQGFIKLGIFFSITGIAIVIPSIVSFVNIVGCAFTVILGFIFPTMIYIKQKYDSLTLGKTGFAIFLMIFGIFGGLNGLYATLYSSD